MPFRDSLDEWVRTPQIVCPKGQRSALPGHQLSGAVDAADAKVCNEVVEGASDLVMNASGEYGGFLRRWDTDPASASRFWSRARLDGSPLRDQSVHFADRHGLWHLSFQTAERRPKPSPPQNRNWSNSRSGDGTTIGADQQQGLVQSSHVMGKPTDRDHLV